MIGHSTRTSLSSGGFPALSHGAGFSTGGSCKAAPGLLPPELLFLRVHFPAWGVNLAFGLRSGGKERPDGAPSVASIHLFHVVAAPAGAQPCVGPGVSWGPMSCQCVNVVWGVGGAWVRQGRVRSQPVLGHA